MQQPQQSRKSQPVSIWHRVLFGGLCLLTAASLTVPVQAKNLPVAKPLDLPETHEMLEHVSGEQNLAAQNVDEELKWLLVTARTRQNLNQIFEFDHKPLGSRIPVILVPGRAEEFQHSSWWKGFRELSQNDPVFEHYFKLYAYIYNSEMELDVQADDFYHDLKRRFGHLPKSQPLMLVTYSLGGVITREVLKEPSLLQQVDTIIGIAVPFHGSPLFDPDWFSKYMRPPNRSPIRKAWDQLLYRGYMFGKSNLTRGLKWDNFDSSKPQFEANKVDVAGDQIIPNVEAFQEYPNADAIREKTIVYASYLENGYTHSNQALNPRRLPRYVLENSMTLPKELVATVLPLYGFSVHSVFTYMNHQMSNIPSYTPEDPQGKNTHLYRYNDGAIPLSSMLFLPASKKPYDGELFDLIKQATVRKVRIFVNIDHMHIGEYTMFKSKLPREDLISPEEGIRSPHRWIMYDLIQRVESEKLRPLKVQYRYGALRTQFAQRG